jgi:hypothetical protein
MSCRRFRPALTALSFSRSGETIFLGRTVATEKVEAAAHFIAAESFRGAAVAGGEIVIYSDGSNRGYPFVAGTSYLVYATQDANAGFLYTSRCSETRPAVMAGGVLRELRRCTGPHAPG